MNYNIHPIIVHFPVAFLFIYSVLKILPFKKWFKNTNWSHVEIIILITGVLGAWAGNATGEMAEHMVRVNREVLQMHTFFAGATSTFYVILLAGELLPFITLKITERFNFMNISKLLLFFQKILSNRVVMILLAILGLVAVSMTGLLGGVMVYGTTADPLAAPVLKMLGITL